MVTYPTPKQFFLQMIMIECEFDAKKRSAYASEALNDVLIAFADNGHGLDCQDDLKTLGFQKGLEVYESINNPHLDHEAAAKQRRVELGMPMSQTPTPLYVFHGRTESSRRAKEWSQG